MSDTAEAKNTDRELWRECESDYYTDSLHVTEGGGIGINVGGHVIVKSLKEWHRAALAAARTSTGKGGSGEMTDAQVKAAWSAIKPYLLGSRLDKAHAALRAALAAVQAEEPGTTCIEDGRIWKDGHYHGFAAGIEACCNKAYDLGAPSGLIAAFRALRPHAAPAEAPHKDWLIDGHECTKESWDNLDWSTAWMDKGPSPAGNMGPYWHVMDRDGDCQHRLYFKPLHAARLALLRQSTEK